MLKLADSTTPNSCSGSEPSPVEAIFLIPGRKLWRPVHQVWPHQIAEVADLELSIEFGPKIHEVKKGSQAETHNEMLAVVERENAAGMFLGKS